MNYSINLGNNIAVVQQLKFKCNCHSDDHEEEGETTDILTIPAKAVLISTQCGTITLTGLAENAEVTVYDTIGQQQGEAIVTDGIATITTNLATGSVLQ